MRIKEPSSVFHIFNVVSPDPETILVPSEEKQTELTEF